MNYNNEEKEGIIDKFQRLRTRNGTPFLEMGGGIFTPKTRKKILGIMKQPKPGMSTNQFWYKIRNQVERALIDLWLFVEVSGEQNMNQVMTRKSLEDLVYSLLTIQLFKEGPDKNLAEIAQMFIKQGFAYFENMFSLSEYRLPLSSKRTMEEAVDLSEHLLLQVEDIKKSIKERNYYIAQAKKNEANSKTKT